MSPGMSPMRQINCRIQEKFWHPLGMCGIIAILRTKEKIEYIRKRADMLSFRMRHRGPDHRGICVQRISDGISVFHNILCHERLAIVDLLNGAQPLYDITKAVALTVNGEIYNHKQLRKEFSTYKFSTNSDCEAIIPLYMKYGDSFISGLDGDYAFVISDERTGEFFVGRDPIGVFPLFYGRGADGSLWFASEAKALCEDCVAFDEFPPGSYWSSRSGKIVQWYHPVWFDEHYLPTEDLASAKLREALEKSVIKRLAADVPYGVLVSGGLDSSLVASIVCRHQRKLRASHSNGEKGQEYIHTFSIGLENSPDLQAARDVARFLNTTHHEFVFTVEEGIEALSDLIYHIETYDVTTVRASVPMYLMSKRVKKVGVKMVLSGEGADEVFGGYLYFHHAPSAEAFHRETVRKLKLLSKYDCLRANKAPAAWGLEVRVPFLDREFLDVAMTSNAAMKMVDRRTGRIEKHILRKAFHNKEEPYLPDAVLWRQKEQFSDGVGYSWIDGLKAYAEKTVTDEELQAASTVFPYNTPATKEAYLYRRIFSSHFGAPSAQKLVLGGPSIACSTPAAVEWNKSWKSINEPSGRAVADVHASKTDIK